VVVDATVDARVGTRVAGRRADDRAGRVELDRERRVRRVELVQLLEDHLFGDLDLLRLAADDAQRVRVSYATVFFVDVNICTRCFF